MPVILAQVSHGSHPLDSPRLLGAHGYRAQLRISGDGLGDIRRHQDLRLALDGHRHVVAPSHLGALGPRAAIGIGQGELGRTACRDLLHTSTISLRARLESLDLLLQLLSCRVMDTGCLPIRRIQITHVLRHLLIEIRESLLKRCLRNVLVCVVDGLDLTAIEGEEYCPKESQRPAQKDTRSEENLQSFGVMFSELSHGLDGGSPCSQQPDERHVALGVPL
jgi:hypothetical protein